MAYVESNGHVTDYVTWPWKVKLVYPIRLDCNILKTAGDALLDSLLWGSKVGYPSDSLASCYRAATQFQRVFVAPW